MMSYYPSQGSYRHEQPVYEYPSSHHDYSHSHRHRHHSFGDDYHVQQPTTYEPSHGVGYGYSRHHDFPAAIAVQTAPIVMVCFFSYHCVFAFSTDWTNNKQQPIYDSHHSHHDGSGYRSHPLGKRLRYFFGFAPRAKYDHNSDRSFWGFMGYSRRSRY